MNLEMKEALDRMWGRVLERFQERKDECMCAGIEFIEIDTAERILNEELENLRRSFHGENE